MPVPSPRNKILPARGNFADLDSNVSSLLDGEICYAVDEDQYYQVESGALVSVGATKGQGALADSAVQTVNGKSGESIIIDSDDVGLGQVDNTPDVDKPISTATQAALDLKADLIDGKIPNSQLPSLAITEFLGDAASEEAMLLLVGELGDWCIRTDYNNTWVITGTDSSELESWTELATPADLVTSVNGYQGAVVLGPDDVGAATAAQGALADTAVQPGDNVSDLTNDAGYITATGTYWTEGTNQLYPTDAGNDVLIGGTLPSAPNILLNADGSIDAVADATINSMTVGRGGGSVSSNTAVGNNALVANNTGSFNTAIGQNALQTNTTGTGNTAIGRQALSSNTGSFNTAIAQSALTSNTEGGSNTAIGRSALANNNTGNFNTAVGRNAGNYIEGSNNTILGAYQGTSADATLSDTVIISAGATERLRIDSSGNATFTGAITSEGAVTGDTGVFGNLTTFSNTITSTGAINLTAGGTGRMAFKSKGNNNEYRFFRTDETAYGDLRFTNITANRIFQFPDTAGTVALTKDLTPIVAVYKAPSGTTQSIDSTTDVLLDISTASISDANFSNTGGAITIGEAGIYEVHCSVGMTGTTANYRHTGMLTCKLNSVVQAEVQGGYLRSLTSFDSYIDMTHVLSVSANDVVSFTIRRVTADTGDGTTVDGISRIIIKKL